MGSPSLFIRLIEKEIVIDFSEGVNFYSTPSGTTYTIEFKLYHTDLCNIADDVRLETGYNVLPMYSLSYGKTDRTGRYDMYLRISQYRDEEPIVRLPFVVISKNAVDNEKEYEIPLLRQEHKVIMQEVGEQIYLEFGIKNFKDYIARKKEEYNAAQK